MITAPTRPTSAALDPDGIEEQFQRLAAVWRQAVPFSPKEPVHYAHPAYQEILRMGPAVVPHLLRALAEERRHWFWALHQITGADPVSSEEQGSMVKMTEAWLRWGRLHGQLNEENPTLMNPPVLTGNENPLQATESTAAGEDAAGLATRFRQLASIWLAETGFLSSPRAITNHPAYQEILGLGQAAVPLMLRELAEQPHLWVWALPQLTGANPVAESDRGNLAKMSAAWLDWAKEHGYRW